MRTRKELEKLLEDTLESSRAGDDELLDRCLIELTENEREKGIKETETRLWNEARKVPGGYEYAGVCSDQLCFWLREGGELRLSYVETDADPDNPGDGLLHIDHYDGKLPPGISGPAWKTPKEE